VIAMTGKKPRNLLYLDGVSVSFDGFKALNSLSFVVEPGETARDHRPPMAPARRR
jgi:urea transport system ATP-binding protein